MISRRLIRIKILQALYAYGKTDEITFNAAEKQLFYSLQKSYDLYFYILLLLVDVSSFAQNRIDTARAKHFPTEDDLHPNTRFIDNTIIKTISNHPQFTKYLNEHKLSWVNYPELIKALHKHMHEEEYFKQYMQQDKLSVADQKQWVIEILNQTLANFEPVVQALEEQSIFWNIELDFAISMLVKTVKNIDPNQPEKPCFMNQYRQPQDLDFAKRLFRKSVLNRDQCYQLIKAYAKNWEFERIAYIDVLIMQMAITEVLEFPSIPVKVSINEYLDIVKDFSTNNSHVFVNGILDKAINQLKQEKKVVKTGRGLME